LPPAMQEPFVRESYRLESTVPVFDGMLELLKQLTADGFRLAVATGKSGERARSLLRALDILELFDHVIGSDEVTRPKPAPDIVLRALELIGAGAGEAVMVGDAPADIRSALGAAVTPIGALWAPRVSEDELRAAGAEILVREPAELAGVLDLTGPLTEGHLLRRIGRSPPPPAGSAADRADSPTACGTPS
jgi:AHBA synthesis associated protein